MAEKKKAPKKSPKRSQKDYERFGGITGMEVISKPKQKKKGK